MHECPECGMVCTCNGDIDDTYVMTEEWVNTHCIHDCDELEDEEEDYVPNPGIRCGCKLCYCSIRTEYGEPCGDCTCGIHQG